MRKIILILILAASAVMAYAQGTPKDTVNVLAPSEITAGTLVDSVNIYHVQGGSWKKNTMANLATYMVTKNGFGVTDGNKGDITIGGSATTFNVNTGAIGADELASTAVTPGTYSMGRFTVDADGRLTAAAADTLCLIIACSDETSNLTTSTAKVTFRAPSAMTIVGVRANVNTAPVGSTIIVDINEGGVSIFSTNLSIDASEKTSVTAASAAVISDTSIANDAEVTIDIDQIGSSTAGKGLKVHIYYIKP